MRTPDAVRLQAIRHGLGVAPAQPAAVHQENREAEKLTNIANVLVGVCSVFLIIGALVVYNSGFSSIRENGLTTGIWVGLGIMTTAIPIFFFAQLYHIRAGLERLRK